MHLIHPILFIDLLKQSSYKNTILLSMMHKQLTYFSKKYSKSNRVTLSKVNKLSNICEKDNIKATTYIHGKVFLIDDYLNFLFNSVKLNNIKIVRYFLNYGFDTNYSITQTIITDDSHYHEWHIFYLYPIV